MTLTLHTIASSKGSRTKKFRVGRGRGTGRGTTAGRGTKGQRARSGGRNKLRLKGLKQMLLGFPKMRGFTSLKAKAVTIPLSRLTTWKEGMVVSLEHLKQQGMVTRSTQTVKIVGRGAFHHKIVVEGVLVSAGAKAAIEKAGGSIKAQKVEKKKAATK